MNTAVLSNVDRHDPFEFGELEGAIETTESQREVWLAAQFGDEASASFNESVFLRLKGRVNQPALKKALEALWQRHQAIRGCFSDDGKEMVIYYDRPAPVTHHDISTLTPKNQEEQLTLLAQRAVSVPFDLANGPLAQFDIIRFTEDDTRVLLTLHHSVCDGWSLYILASELGELYSRECEPSLSAGLEPAPSFIDYAEWERSDETRSLREQSIDYWTRRFADGIPTLDLPFDRPRLLSRSFSAFRLDKDLPLSLLAELKALSAKNNSTITTTLMAAFAGYIHRISGCEDIVLGIPFAGQMAKEEHNLVGHCVNIIPLHIKVSGEDSFRALLHRTQQCMLDAFEHQYLTYGTLLQTLGVSRDPSKPPLVSILFNVDLTNESDFQFTGLDASFESNPRVSENFDLNLNITISSQSAVMECTHNLHLWNTETIDRRLDELLLLLRGVSTKPESELGQLNILRSADLALYQAQWESVCRPYDLTRKSLHGLIEVAVDQFPDRCALIYEGKELSYRELDEQANSLAHWLNAQGVKAETIVPILMDRSLTMLVAINGVLKAGGAYLPLDPDHPHDRLAFIIDEVKAKFVLTQTALKDRVPGNVEAVAIDSNAFDLSQFSKTRPNLPCSPDQLAYVMYTSGSTGKPKGVMLEHQSICNHMLWMKETFPLDQADSVVLKTPYTFDVSLCELFLPLMTGSRLVIARPGGHKDPLYLAELIQQHQITQIHFVPSLAYLFLDVCHQEDCPSIRRFLLTGEAVSTELEARFTNAFPDAECWNLYGPTEAAVHASSWLCGQEQVDFTVPIGKALPNTRLYVVDSQGNLLSPGLAGELLIGGVQVARGYIARPELTAERFVEDPFSSESFKAYHTGDLVKMRTDGVLEYIGRNDFQVKLRGLRIELGEIESIILRYPGITQCAVLAREDRVNDQRLVAYIVAGFELEGELLALKAHIGQNLPDYMLPQHFLQLPALPLTSSGKVDRKALPAPDLTISSGADHVEPESPLESELSDLWCNILGLPSISTHANFFDLGGHSLLGTQMLARIKSQYGIVLGLGKLFEAPTIHAMARLIEQELQHGQRTHRIQARPKDSVVHATPQQQVWFLYEKIVPESFAFNLPAVFRFQGSLDISALEQAINTVLQRHEILRAQFRNIDGQVQILVDDSQSIQLTPKPISEFGISDIASLERALMTEVSTSFNIESGPLFKAKLIQVSEQDHVLFLLIHHLVFDGWSFDLLLKEMCALYNAYTKGLENPLADLPVQFQDFAIWQQEWLQSEALEAQLNYWKQKLAGDLPILSLPLDFDRPHVQPHRSKGIKFEIDEATTKTLETLAVRHQTTLFLVLMSLYVLMLHRFSRQSDLIINVPVYARNEDELSGLVGPFINLLVCRFRISQDQSFDELVQHVKETVLTAIDHQDVPFETLVRTINPPRDSARNPIAQTLFNYQDVRNRQDQMEGIQRSQINLDRTGVETDLDVWFKRQREGIEAGFEYPIELFRQATIEGFVESFKDSIKVLSEEQDEINLQRLVCASEDEKSRISDWNNTAREWAFGEGFLSAFEQQVTAHPDKVSCRSGENAFSFQELDQRSNQLARFFASRGVQQGDVVALLLERNVDMPAAIIAIWKLGAAYVPLDASYPDERIRLILEVAQARLLVTCSNLVTTNLVQDTKTLLLDAETQASHEYDESPVTFALQSEQLAYVIFTSGSTGVPKGVEISHGALHNFLMAVAEKPGLGEKDQLLAITTLAFDISLLELFLPLSVGATVVIATTNQSSDPYQLKSLIEQHGITTLQATPATWRLLMNVDLTIQEPLKGLIGGEKLPADLANLLVQRGVELWNMYGPTEATVWTSCYRIPPGRGEGALPRILIGRPLANTQLHVLDEQGNTMPLGVYGELCISGAGLANGYRGNPEQTAERFIRFSNGQHLYRTGDLARWTWDGQIEFGDRIDNQVKVRGYRIELEEIEIKLRVHPAIADAAVVVQTFEADDQRLIAHIVYSRDEKPTSSELRKHLRHSLPDYMMPQLFTAHDHLPLLPSGKVNRKLLMQTKSGPATKKAENREPTKTEGQLISIWKTVLQIDEIALDDQFLEVGGHSLLALKVIVDIEHMTGAKLMPQDLWVNTLEQLAKLVEQKLPASNTEEPRAESNTKPKKHRKNVFRRLFGPE
ncbi:amino acid adenylation domain-containing protein [Marinobacter sp. es.042]|uniref:non-ribosomal peptide synthetase n=1 Tax=Marinobacter sp. es.042 TaxID=1761794 RepID=UPI000B50AE0E|nr:non-ribosomal peptide synthetase [Marinobacter sp. es.042]SNB55511.1 amino acid adenylation domain-containing protein [Marinobacter sp. es.042]